MKRYLIKSAVWRWNGKYNPYNDKGYLAPCAVRHHFIQARSYKQAEKLCDQMTFKNPERKVWSMYDAA